MFHVVVEKVDPRTGISLGMGQTRMTATPVTHNEGCTIMRKITDYPWRRKMLVEAES